MDSIAQRKTLNIPEVAQMLGISVRSAYVLAQRPDFPAFRISPHRLLVSVEGLDRWIQAQLTSKEDA